MENGFTQAGRKMPGAREPASDIGMGHLEQFLLHVHQGLGRVAGHGGDPLADIGPFDVQHDFADVVQEPGDKHFLGIFHGRLGAQNVGGHRDSQ